MYIYLAHNSPPLKKSWPLLLEVSDTSTLAPIFSAPNSICSLIFQLYSFQYNLRFQNFKLL